MSSRNDISANWFYSYETVPTAPLIGNNIFDNFTGKNPSYTISWSNQSLCSDKEHPLSEQYEDEDGSLVMRIALAGYPKENISVDFADNILIVKADKVEDEHKSLSIAKRACTKEFIDSKGVWDFNETKAVYKDGLLTLRIPKKKEKRPVKVSIE